MTIYNTAFGKEKLFLEMTFLFGLIIIGNILDNVSQPKWVLIFLQLTLCLTWSATGGIVYLIQHDPEFMEKELHHEQPNF